MAVPLLKGAVPMDTPLSSNVTGPVGVPLNCGVTVAINVTLCPNSAGEPAGAPAGVAVTVVVVLAWFTVWRQLPDVLVLKFTSLAYTAVIVCVPTLSITDNGGTRIATSGLPAFNAAVPIGVPPSWNVTGPVGVPLNCGVTVAVNVTDCPNSARARPGPLPE